MSRLSRLDRGIMFPWDVLLKESKNVTLEIDVVLGNLVLFLSFSAHYATLLCVLYLAAAAITAGVSM